MKRYRITAARSLRGRVTVPGDKSIGHRTLLFGALAEGDSIVRGLSGGLDNVATADAMRAMGASIDYSDGERGQTAKIRGVGLRGLKMPKGHIDCGNSGTTMRLLAGLLVAQRFGTRLIGDASLTGRPMMRIVDPLRARGGHIAGVKGKKEGEQYPPLSVAPLIEGEELIGIEYEMPVASAQVKSALLFSGLYAAGPTALREPVLSRDHTERMMLALGVPIETVGPMVVLDPDGWRGGWSGFEWDVPGDPSSAAFFLAAANIVKGSEIAIEGVGINPTRTGLLDALRPMQAAVEVVPKGEGAGGEPLADLEVRSAPLVGGLVGGELVTRMIDEVPALCAIAAFAKGKTTVRDARELRVKESDRIATMAGVLRAFGVECQELDDGMIVHGTDRARPARVESRGDHRIAMSAALLAMRADGESIVDDVGCVETSFPGFAAKMRALGADIVEEDVAE